MGKISPGDSPSLKEIKSHTLSFKAEIGSLQKKQMTPGLTRRSHKKSRGGCFHCKQKHIRCSQERPSCHQCMSKKLPCYYEFELAKRRQSTGLISLTPSDVIPEDLKALHHFLMYCPLAVPIGNHEVWTMDIPQLAHHQPFLMNAILGLGLSHFAELSKCVQSNERALHYRSQALAGLRHHITVSQTWSPQDTDAALAAMHALTFQTSYIPAALGDYKMMLRGCILVTEHVRKASLKTSFDLSPNRVNTRFEGKMSKILPGKSCQAFVAEVSEALQQLEVHLNDPIDQAFLNAVRFLVARFEKAGPFALLTAIDGYSRWYDLEYPYLERFLKPDYYDSLMILTHFLSVQLVLTVLLPLEWWPNLVTNHPPGIVLTDVRQWVEAFNTVIAQRRDFELAWPLSVVNRIPASLEKSSRRKIMIMSLEKKIERASHMNEYAHIVLGCILQGCTGIASWLESLLQMKIMTAD